MGSLEDFLFKTKGGNPTARNAYKRVFNSRNSDNSDGRIILNDLIMQFKFYGAKPTLEPIELAKQAARREVIEYILAMSARLSNDTLSEIEQFINSK